MDTNHENAAAILLCAGKGTRMGQSDRSKVAYDGAGVPVIKRIIRNMRDGRVLGILEAKDIRRARETGATLALCGQAFTPDEVSAMPYVNAALYAFDVEMLGDALKTLRPDNAQGELYLTDVVEWFALKVGVSFYQISLLSVKPRNIV